MRHLIICTFLAISIPSFGTAQLPDLLIFNGDELRLYSNPLEQHLAKTGRPTILRQGVISSGNWRGYQATWEIDDSRLYLTKIEKRYAKESTEDFETEWRELPISLIFPAEKQRVFASWYSGTLKVPKGKRLAYVHMGYGSSFEIEIRIVVNRGEVVSIDELRNNTESIPSECDAVTEQLRTMTAGGGNDPEQATSDPQKLYETEQLRIQCQQSE